MEIKKLLKELGVEVSAKAIKIVNGYSKEKIESLKLREVYRRLVEEYGSTMTREQVLCELNISKEKLTGLIEEGTAPEHWRTSGGKKSSFRFLTISVSEFLS